MEKILLQQLQVLGGTKCAIGHRPRDLDLLKIKAI